MRPNPKPREQPDFRLRARGDTPREHARGERTADLKELGVDPRARALGLPAQRGQLAPAAAGLHVAARALDLADGHHVADLERSSAGRLVVAGHLAFRQAAVRQHLARRADADIAGVEPPIPVPARRRVQRLRGELRLIKIPARRWESAAQS